MIELIPIDELKPHPDNPRLFLREEVVNSITAQIKDNGGKFDEAHALLVRPFNGHYQIIQGHHRHEGAMKAGLQAVPCWVRDMNDEEAYMALALGNVQGELSPLEIGIHALRVVEIGKVGQGRGNKGGLAEYSRLLARDTGDISRYRQAATVLKTSKILEYSNILDKAAHLAHIHKVPQETWATLAQWLITPDEKGKTPSATRTEKLVKQIGKYSIPDEYKEFYPLETIVKSYIGTQNPTLDAVNSAVNLVRTIEGIIKTNSEKFPHDLFPFTVEDFNDWLRDGVGTHTWEVGKLREYQTDVVMAAQEAYKPQPADCQPGQWYKLGDHLLYCGDTSQPEFYNELPKVPFIFADPPYNAKVGKWDEGFEWGHDWISDKGEVAAVTPGIANIQSFFKNDTDMICNWSMSCWIDNGQTRGALGFGNWIYIALFYDGSIHKNTQDHLRASISTADTKDSKHRGRKPPGLMKQLIELFSEVGETIIDPFLGSGTTLFEADTLGRHCVGGEIDPEFCNQIINRWQEKTGQAAEKLTNE